jgi:hypothetical protein
VLYRRRMWSATKRRRVSVIAGYLWLTLASQMFLVAMLFTVVSPAALVYAVLGVAALTLAAMLFTQPGIVPLFIASTGAGLLSALAGLMAVFRPGLLP